MLFTVNAYPPAFSNESLNDFVVVAAFNATAGKSAFSSTLGNTWTQGDTLPSIAKSGVLYGNGVWITFGGDGPVGFIERSTDGAQTWTSIKSNEVRMKVGAFSPQLNRFFIGGTKDTGNWYSDDNGATFTFVDNATSVISISDVNGCVWAPQLGKFLTVPGSLNNTIETLYAATSSDGIIWDLHATGTGTSYHWGAVDWSPALGRFTAVAATTSGAGGETQVSFYSSDGANWVQGGNLPSTGYWYCVKWNPVLGKFLALKEGSSAAALSTDGINWTSVTMHRSADWCDLACTTSGLFCAVAKSATCSISTDGENWTDVTLPDSMGANQITNGRLS